MTSRAGREFWVCSGYQANLYRFLYLRPPPFSWVKSECSTFSASVIQAAAVRIYRGILKIPSWPYVEIERWVDLLNQCSYIAKQSFLSGLLANTTVAGFPLRGSHLLTFRGTRIRVWFSTLNLGMQGPQQTRGPVVSVDPAVRISYVIWSQFLGLSGLGFLELT